MLQVNLQANFVDPDLGFLVLALGNISDVGIVKVLGAKLHGHWNEEMQRYDVLDEDASDEYVREVEDYLLTALIDEAERQAALLEGADGTLNY